MIISKMNLELKAFDMKQKDELFKLQIEGYSPYLKQISKENQLAYQETLSSLVAINFEFESSNKIAINSQRPA